MNIIFYEIKIISYNNKQKIGRLIKHSSEVVLFNRQIEIKRTQADIGSVTRTLFEVFKCLSRPCPRPIYGELTPYLSYICYFFKMNNRRNNELQI